MKYIRFSDFNTRLSTFPVGWKGCKDKHDLAHSGFFFTGGRDSVQCFDCGAIVYNWEPQDDVDIEHVTHSPKCDHARRRVMKRKLEAHTSLLLAALERLQDLKTDVRDVHKCVHSLYLRGYSSGAEDEVDFGPRDLSPAREAQQHPSNFTCKIHDTSVCWPSEGEDST